MDNTLSTVQMKLARAGEQSPEPLRKATGERSAPSVEQLETRESPAESQRAMMEKLADQLAEFVRESGRQLEFQVNEERGRVVILVKHSESGEVLRTIPPDEAQRMAMSAGAEGVLINRRA
ncbi:flagellar protein FlaG [Wenzhouxiangella sp. AB-CW3]|uniref:flagellar protein FlaG n=1 Tax=Wenzhouxiangella sp. AB-CW3 TaxID=2771012 RepID=UPI00168B2E89|nr:flagellar protein FlaG [Wenzhouxiangella sp. AB-CW3]QOC21215.1 flagellar protein FlaG [Wenzhouxiangella sp. AB-CW3]